MNIGEYLTRSKLVEFIFHDETFMVILLDNLIKLRESQMQVLSLDELEIVSGGYWWDNVIDEQFGGNNGGGHPPKNEDSKPLEEP